MLVNTICPVCGGHKDKSAKVCFSCKKLKQCKVVKPEKDILLKEIALYGFSYVGRCYGVSDTAIIKWCRFYNLPSHISDIRELYYQTVVVKDADVV